MMMMMMMIIFFKNRIERRNSRFFTLLTAPRTISDTHAQVARAQSCAKPRATHRAHITCNTLRATWNEGTAQLLSLTELKSHLF